MRWGDDLTPRSSLGHLSASLTNAVACSYILSQNSNVRVTAIARGSFDEFDKAGIQIESEKFGVIEGWRPYRMVRNAEEANDRAYKYIVRRSATVHLPALTLGGPILFFSVSAT